MSAPPPGLAFLALNGTPDPRRPTPLQPGTQLPSQSQMPEYLRTPEDLHPQGRENPQQKGTPGPRPRGYVNFPGADIYGLEVEQAIRTLGEANIQVALPGQMIPAPNQELDPDFHEMDETNKTFLRVLEKSGRVTKAAAIAGLARSTFHARKQRNPKFAALWDKALKYRSELLEDEAIRRAVNGVKKNVYYMGAVVGQENVYSDALLSKLLEGNMPEKYRQNHKIELEGKMAVATLVLPSTTSAEEWAAQNSGTIIDQEPEDEYA